MKTLESTGPLLIGVDTDATPGVPKGKMHVYCVRYDTYLLDETNPEDLATNFKIHDANHHHAIIIARAVKL